MLLENVPAGDVFELLNGAPADLFIMTDDERDSSSWNARGVVNLVTGHWAKFCGDVNVRLVRGEFAEDVNE